MTNETRVIPIAERVVEFRGSEIRLEGNGSFRKMNSLSQEQLEELLGNSLVLGDGYNIRQYLDEYPIVKYKGYLRCCEFQLLNSFVKSISVSIADAGKKYSINSGKMKEEFDGEKVVVYYEDNQGNIHEIIQNDIFRFLLRRPNLVVSPEGMLVFYTNKLILATLDCNQYYWVSNAISKDDSTVIKEIKVQEDNCLIILDNKDVKGQMFELKFVFDFVNQFNPICLKISKL